SPPALRLATGPGRWAVAAAVVGSGVVFIEGTVVTVALPRMAADLGLGMSGVQGVLNGYFVTLSALILLGGALGDRFGTRRVFVLGLLGFATFSLLCAVAPGLPSLVGFRVAQGAAGALLVPNSLALLHVAFDPADRGAAIGRWSAWSAVSTAAGPLVGGWLVDVGSWRWVFAVMVPFALVAAVIGWLKVDDRTALTEGGSGPKAVDWGGAALATLGLGTLVGGLISGQERGFADPLVLTGVATGATALLAFLLVESRVDDPLLPPDLFRNRQFAGGNAVTFLLYTAINALFFLLVVQLQNGLGYSALEAGAALLPVNVFMLLLSSRAGRVGARIGPGWPVALGSLLAGAGLLLLAGIRRGDGFVADILPGLSLFGLGLAALVAPLTDAVLSSAGEGRGGVASGVNNAVARVAGLGGTAALPLAVGLGGLEELAGPAFVSGYARALVVSAALCGIAALVAPLTLRACVPGRAILHPSPTHGCVERPLA
ncbi:MAG TPA: DHA2 family efflux MFS transporter permease subunit, partial [Longimicrobiales bacterium]|nr:DHA2 family efflux MFS transporter permease subunit [Longimicrobiales bacterium]